MYQHILDDGHLDKLDLEFVPADPNVVKFIIPDSLKAMELPSKVTLFTADDVVECLKAGGKIAREQLLREYARMMDAPNLEDKEIF